MIKLVLLFCIVYGIYFIDEAYNKFKINRKIKKCEEYEKEFPKIDEEIKPNPGLTPAQLKYHEYLKTEHWQKLRKVALERAGYRCQVCSSEYKLQVHHNSYLNRGNESLFDLCVLCDECHGLFHKRNYYQNQIRRIK